jgi:hypothetical protein
VTWSFSGKSRREWRGHEGDCWDEADPSRGGGAQQEINACAKKRRRICEESRASHALRAAHLQEEKRGRRREEV